MTLPEQVDRVRWLIFFALAGLFAPRAALGYIDPASGSLILQIVAAGVLAATFTFKRLWFRIATAIRSALRRIGPRAR